MANELKFVCSCKTVVLHIYADSTLTLKVHGVVEVTCTVCGKKFQYADGTGGAVSIAKDGGITVSQ